MRLITLFLLLLLLAIQYPLWLGKGGWLRVWDMQKQVTVTLLDGRETALYVVPSTPAPEGPRRWRNKSSAHRTFALCPDCLKAVPAGRTHQHKCKGN